MDRKIKIAELKIKETELIYVEFNDGIIIIENIKEQIPYIKKNIYNIKKIVVVTISSSMLSYTAVLKNNKLHNVETYSFSSSEIDENTGKSLVGEFYYINGINISYKDWLEHPEKIRHERNKKLQLI